MLLPERARASVSISANRQIPAGILLTQTSPVPIAHLGATLAYSVGIFSLGVTTKASSSH